MRLLAFLLRQQRCPTLYGCVFVPECVFGHKYTAHLIRCTATEANNTTTDTNRAKIVCVEPINITIAVYPPLCAARHHKPPSRAFRTPNTHHAHKHRGDFFTHTHSHIFIYARETCTLCEYVIYGFLRGLSAQKSIRSATATAAAVATATHPTACVCIDGR